MVDLGHLSEQTSWQFDQIDLSVRTDECFTPCRFPSLTLTVNVGADLHMAMTLMDLTSVASQGS